MDIEQMKKDLWWQRISIGEENVAFAKYFYR